MRIVKTPFKTEIEFKPSELDEIQRIGAIANSPLAAWLRKYLDFDIYQFYRTKKK